jgi:hypothetical protein
MSGPEDHDDAPLDLSSLAPRESWVTELPEVGRRAARSRADDGLLAQLQSSARWFVPLAAATVAASWVVAAMASAPDAPPSSALLAGAEQDVAHLLLAGGGRD